MTFTATGSHHFVETTASHHAAVLRPEGSLLDVGARVATGGAEREMCDLSNREIPKVWTMIMI